MVTERADGPRESRDNEKVGMHDFRDDGPYLGWLDDHPDGYVVNTTRPPAIGNVMLHRATCHHVRRAPHPDSCFTREKAKYASTDRGELERWARHTVGGPPQPCGICKP